MEDFDDDVTDSSGDEDTGDHGGNGEGPLKCVHCGYVVSQLVIIRRYSFPLSDALECFGTSE